MLRPGLVSVTFRALSPREIIKLCVQSGLEAIEWGGDVHAPPDDLSNARALGRMTRDAGLQVAAYGSYWRCDGSDFEPILQCAQALGAPSIRVWAGQIDASAAAKSDWARLSDELTIAGELARAANVQVAVEYHGGTLNSDGDSAARLMRMVAPAVQTLWQPLRRGPNFEDRVEENLSELRVVAPDLGNVHVYQWADDAKGKCQRLPLASSAGWPRYIEELRRIGRERWLLLEFVPDDEPDVLLREAATLRRWIGE